MKSCDLFKDSRRVSLNVSAQEIRGIERSTYNSHLHKEFPTSSLSHILRLGIIHLVHFF